MAEYHSEDRSSDLPPADITQGSGPDITRAPTLADIPDEECPITELNRRSCDHCRQQAGISSTSGMTMDGISTTSLTLDLGGQGAGSDQKAAVWLEPDEAFQRGEFGNGRHRY